MVDNDDNDNSGPNTKKRALPPLPPRRKPEIGKFKGSYQPPPPPPQGVAPYRETPQPPTVPPRANMPISEAPLPPPFVDPSAELPNDMINAAAKRIEQEYSQLHFARHGSFIASKANIEQTADGSFTVTITFPGRDKAPQSRMYNREDIENYAKAEKNKVPLPSFPVENQEVDDNMVRAIKVARTPIKVPKELKKFSKNLDKGMEQFINNGLTDSTRANALYKKHFNQSNNNVIQRLERNPNLKAQFKYLLAIEYLAHQSAYTQKEPSKNQAAILDYLSQRLSQAGALLKGSGYEPPQNTSRPPAIAHSQNMQRSRGSAFTSKTEVQVDKTPPKPPPRPGGNRNNI